jgi:parallel beta-helix repeat protein
MQRFGKSAGITLLLILLTFLFTVLTVQASTTVIVTPTALNGWTETEAGSGVVAITGTNPRSGNGSLQFDGDDGTARTRFQYYWDPTSFPNRTLGNLTAVAYEWYRTAASTNPAVQQPAFQLAYLNTANGNSGYLTWEEAYNGSTVPTNTWVSESMIADNFWMRAFDPGRTIDDYNVSLAEWIAGADEEGSPIDDDADADAPHVLNANVLIYGIEIGAGSGWNGDYTMFVDNVSFAFGASDAFTFNFELTPPVVQCTTVCYVSPTGSDSNGGTSIADAKLTIQAAIDQVNASGQVRVLPGTYSETASGRTLFDGTGPYTFGLFFDEDKPGITVMGVTAADVPITDPSAVLARVNTNATNGFGPSGIFVDAANITVQGLEIGTNASGQNKTIEVIADNFTLQHSYINDPDGSVYINDFTATGNRVLAYKIDNNRFAGGVSVDLASGAGLTGPVSGRVITNNTFTNSTAFDQNWPFISFNGSGTGVPWFVNSVGGAIITGNEFTHNDADVMDSPTDDQQFIRARGTYDNSQFDWQSYWEDNTYNKATVALVGASGFDVRTYSYTSAPYTFNNVRRIGGEIQPEVSHTVDGDRVLINRNTIAGGAASYPEQVTVSNKDITLQGVAEADVIIVPPRTLTTVAGVIAQVTFDGGSVAQMYDLTVDGPIHDDGCAPDAFGVYVHDGSSLTASGITVNDSNLGTASLYGCQTGIGIFIGGDSAATTGTAILTDVTVTNYQKGGIVATNTGSSVSVSSSTISAATFVQPFIAPNGVQVSDGATGTITDNTISQNKCDLGGGSCGPIGVGTFQAAGIIIFDSPSVTIDGNTITDNDMGVYNFGTNTTVTQNAFTANRYAGIFADEGTATITSNTIDGGEYGVLAYGYDTATFTSIATDSYAELSFNIFTNTSVALALIDDNPADGFKPVIKANRNSIIGGTGTGSNDESFRNKTTVSMDIECNWWGDAAGPYDDNTGGPGPSSSGELYGPGDFTPWLLSSDLNGPCSTVLPNAVDDDSYTTPFNTPLVVAAPGVLGNDTGTSITVTSNTTPGSGTLTVNPVAGSGGFTFTPATNFSGVVTFTYTITDAFGQTDTATVTITVGQPGSISINKSVNVVRGTAPTNTFEVCVSGGSLSAPVCQNVMGGSSVTFSNLAPGAYTVSETNPGANWTVTGGGSVTVVSNQTARTTITNTYAVPLDNEPEVFCPAGMTQVGGVYMNTVHIPDTPRINANIVMPEAGTVSLYGASMVGHPELGCPTSGHPTCAQGQTNEEFNILINDVWAAFVPDHGEDQWQTFNFADVLSLDAGRHTISFVHTSNPGAPPSAGSVTFKYVACASFDDEYPVEEEQEYEIEDLVDDAAPVEEAPDNTAPNAQDDGADVGVDQPVTLDVLGNDSDADGDALTVIAVSQPANGIAIINGDGSIGYLPNAGFTGSDPFMYTIDDGRGGTASAIIWITVR